MSQHHGQQQQVNRFQTEPSPSPLSNLTASAVERRRRENLPRQTQTYIPTQFAYQLSQQQPNSFPLNLLNRNTPSPPFSTSPPKVNSTIQRSRTDSVNSNSTTASSTRNSLSSINSNPPSLILCSPDEDEDGGQGNGRGKVMIWNDEEGEFSSSDIALDQVDGSRGLFPLNEVGNEPGRVVGNKSIEKKKPLQVKVPKISRIGVAVAVEGDESFDKVVVDEEEFSLELEKTPVQRNQNSLNTLKSSPRFDMLQRPQGAEYSSQEVQYAGFAKYNEFEDEEIFDTENDESLGSVSGKDSGSGSSGSSPVESEGSGTRKVNSPDLMFDSGLLEEREIRKRPSHLVGLKDVLERRSPMREKFGLDQLQSQNLEGNKKKSLNAFANSFVPRMSSPSPLTQIPQVSKVERFEDSKSDDSFTLPFVKVDHHLSFGMVMVNRQPSLPPSDDKEISKRNFEMMRGEGKKRRDSNGSETEVSTTVRKVNNGLNGSKVIFFQK
jgi:hypothetical protein